MSLSRPREENLGRGSTLRAPYVALLTPLFGRLVVIVLGGMLRSDSSLPSFASPPGFHVAIVHERERSLKAPEADLGVQTSVLLLLGTLSVRQNNRAALGYT